MVLIILLSGNNFSNDRTLYTNRLIRNDTTWSKSYYGKELDGNKVLRKPLYGKELDGNKVLCKPLYGKELDGNIVLSNQ